MICCHSSTAIRKNKYWKRTLLVLFLLSFTTLSFSQIHIGNETTVTLTGHTLIISDEMELTAGDAEIARLITDEERPRLVKVTAKKDAVETALAFSADTAFAQSEENTAYSVERITEETSNSIVFQAGESEEESILARLQKQREQYSRLFTLTGVLAAPTTVVKKYLQTGLSAHPYLSSSADAEKSLSVNFIFEIENTVAPGLGTRAPPVV